MKARVTIWGPDGTGYRGVLPTIGLRFSLAAGGGGDVSFGAIKAHMDTVNAGDSVAAVETVPRDRLAACRCVRDPAPASPAPDGYRGA